MKTQRRHELKESDLTRALQSARGYLDQHGKRIGLAVVITGAVALAVGWAVRSKGVAMEEAWRQKMELSFKDVEEGRASAKTLAELIDESNDNQLALEGLIQLGEQSLRLASEVDFPPDRELTRVAAAAFKKLLQRFADDPLAVGIGHLGLATVAENEFSLDGNPKHQSEAAQHLSAIIDDPRLDGMPFKRMALNRRTLLDRTFTPVTFAHPIPPEESADQSAAESTAGTGDADVKTSDQAAVSNVPSPKGKGIGSKDADHKEKEQAPTPAPDEP